MTEYQLSDLMNGMQSNVTQGIAIFLTIQSAYLIVAYTVGKNLTTYQVSFVNLCFIIFALMGIYSQLYNLDQIFEWGAQIYMIKGVEAPELGNASRWTFISIRAVLAIGSLLFMWQIRHPKPELPRYVPVITRPSI